MNTKEHWSRILVTVGSIALLVGALDPLEGAIIILPGSGLVALGTYLNPARRGVVAYNMSAFILVAFGVAAMWVMSAMGGLGGSSGHSMWWGLLILPYLSGWSMGIWRPMAPLWLLLLGIVMGLWYLVLPGWILSHTAHADSLRNQPLLVLVATGILTIGGCIYRWRKRAAQ